MTVMHKHIERMWRQVCKVIMRQFFEGADHSLWLTGGLSCELIRLKFMMPGEHLQERVQKYFNRCEKHTEKDKAGGDRSMIQEECLIELRLFEKPAH